MIRTTTTFQGNCTPEISHHCNGKFTLTTFRYAGTDVAKRLETEMELANLKALHIIIGDALAHDKTIRTFDQEENEEG